MQGMSRDVILWELRKYPCNLQELAESLSLGPRELVVICIHSDSLRKLVLLLIAVSFLI